MKMPVKEARATLLKALVVAAAGLFGAEVLLAQGSSSTYLLSQSTFSSAGSTATSSSFVLDGSLAQPEAVGESSSTAFVLQAGFWTNLSARLVLRVAAAGSGKGSVAAAGIACSLDAGAVAGDCSQSLAHGEETELVASPDAAHRFDSWSGCDSTSTTTLAGDTCRLKLRGPRTVTAAFTALGKVGDRVWRDVDGDGIQDAGEVGLDGVEITLSDGGSFAKTIFTAGDGHFEFPDVPPGSYTLDVDALTLPPGTVPSFDPDGVATPHAAAFAISDGENLQSLDFGYQPQTNLTLQKVDSQDPLPGGQNLVYTLTVQNLGPGIATQVVVHDNLPLGTTLIATSGCGEDPAGTPTCSLGELAIGASASYTIEVSIDPAPPGSIENTATVSSLEVDLDLADNSASQATQLDNGPPHVVLVDSLPTTADGELQECETVNALRLERLLVQFDEPMIDVPGDDAAGDITNPASWSLISAGADAELATSACGPPSGDDVALTISAVAYDAGTESASLEFAAGTLGSGLYRLFACGQGGSVLADLAGNGLDGDNNGSVGGDFVRRFRADPQNFLGNGHLDCDLSQWTLQSSDPAEIAYVAEDLDGSADSGSTAIENLTGGTHYSLRQCAEIAGSEELQFGGWLRLETTGPGIGFQLGCSFYPAASCAGAASPLFVGSTLVNDTGGEWLGFFHDLSVPAGSASALCTASLVDVAAAGFTANVDQLSLAEGTLFADGFESGDTSAWSLVTP